MSLQADPYVSLTGSNTSSSSLTNVIELMESGSEPVRIVCFGDSITGVAYHTGGRRAWCDMLEIALKRIYPQAKLEMHNAGISGNTTTQGLARMNRDVLAYNPHLVVVMYGMNDCTTPERRSVFPNNLKTIVQRCYATNAAVVLCTQNTIYPRSGDTNRFDNLPSSTAAVRFLADEMSVPLADCFLAYENLQALDRTAWLLLMSNVIHPCMSGHKFFAEIIAETISGEKVVLDDVPPPSPSIILTFDRLSRKEPISLIAMPPYDVIMPQVLRTIYPDAVIDTTTWPTNGFNAIRSWSVGIRDMNPTLVVTAVPVIDYTGTDDNWIRYYNDILGYSITMRGPLWDSIAILPSVIPTSMNSNESRHADLARRVVLSRDIGFVERVAPDNSEPKAILQRWVEAQHKIWFSEFGPAILWVTSSAARRNGSERVPSFEPF